MNKISENRIDVEINSTITRLVGNDYGQEVFDVSIKNKIQPNCKNILVIPKSVKKVGISFIQGLVKGISDEYMKDGFYKHFEIDATKAVEDKFREVLIKM